MTRRNRVRVGVAVVAVVAVVGVKVADWSSSRAPVAKRGLRVVSANAAARPLAVVMALRDLAADVILLQETGGSCAEVAAHLGVSHADGSDQCVLAARPMAVTPVEWPGPWQAPQIVTLELDRSLVVANLRLAMPEALAALATLGNQWYSEKQRKEQFAALRRLLPRQGAAMVCGDFNAFPGEVDLGARYTDAWRRRRLGGSFPAWLPVVRIDQCWISPEIVVLESWTRAIPSDHRALVLDVELRGSGGV